jgi:O-antigen ligase
LKRIEQLYLTLALFILSGAYSYFLGTQGANYLSIEELANIPQEGDPKKQFLFIGMYGICGVFFLRYLLKESKVRAVLFLGYPIMLLLLWSWASIFWSVLPDVSFRRCIALLGTVMLGVYAALRFSPGDMFRAVSYVAATAIVGSLLLGLVDPSAAFYTEGEFRGFRGLFYHKNAVGGFAALILVLLAARLFEPSYRNSAARWCDVLLCVTAILCLAVSQSATPIPSLAVGFLLFGGALALRAGDGRLWALLPVIAAVAAVSVPLLAGELRSALVQDFGKTADLSGRTELWKFVTSMVAQHPLVGYGYGAFWGGMDAPAALFWKTTGQLDIIHAHNGYMQLLLDTGVVGGVLFAAGLVALVAKLLWLLRYSAAPFVTWMVAFLGFFLVSNYPESRLWADNEPMTMWFVYVMVRTNLLMRKAAADAAASIGHLALLPAPVADPIFGPTATRRR